MTVRTFLLEFTGIGGMLLPKDKHLHKLAVEYAQQYIVDPINLTDYRKLWMACVCDKDKKPVRCIGVLGMVYRPDFPLVRFTDNAAVVKLVQRANDYFQEEGATGTECFIRIPENEAPEHRCPDWKLWIEALGLVKSERYSITVV